MKGLQNGFLIVILVLLTACGTESQLEEPANADAATLAAAKQLAEQHLSEVRGTDMAPGWEHATLAEARAFHRPDIEGVAYYEFEVKPEGFIVVATGEHDFPVPHWDFEGEPLGQMLEGQAAEQGRQLARFYKLDIVSYAAENSAGELSASLGGLPQQLTQYEDDLRSAEASHAWAAFKASYSSDFGEDLELLRQRASEAWRGSDADLSPQSVTAWKYGWAGGHDKDSSANKQPEYGQFSKAGSDCKSGCAPTAWALLFSWADRQAAAGNARWRNSKGIYRLNGSQKGADRTAPKKRDAGVNNMIWELYDHMGTKCVPQSHDGLTLPWDMTKANKYLEPRSGARVSASWTVRGADPIWDATKGKGLITKTKRSIVDWDTPLVVGVKTNIYTYHYAVAYGYRSRLHQTCTPIGCQTWWTEGQIYLNWGWGAAKNERRGDRGWISDHIWFVGELAPSNRADTFPRPPTTPSCNRPNLKKGSSGTHVEFAQQKLLTKGNPYTYGTPAYFIKTSGGADGDFGTGTYNAVVAFQKMAFPNQPGEWDGIIGSKTWAKLGCN